MNMNIPSLLSTTEEERFQEAVADGYLIVRASPPGQELVAAARSEVVGAGLTTPERDNHGFVYLGGQGGYCEALFHSGFDFSTIPYLTHLLGAPSTEAELAHRGAVVMAHNPRQLPRTRAMAGEAMIWRPLGGSLNAQNGFLRIVRRSKRMGQTEANTAQTVDIALAPNEILILNGDVWIEWPTEGSGLAQYKAYIKRG